MRLVTLSAVLLTLFCIGLALLGGAGRVESAAQDSEGTSGSATLIGAGAPGPALLLAPLYSRLRREGLLNHQLREQILSYVVAHPGACFSQIMRELNLKNGVLAYHIGTLEREKMVRSLRDGAFRRYYPCSSPFVPMEMERLVLRKIEELPGVAVGDLALELGVSRRLLDLHLASLVQRGLVRVERRGKRSHLFTTRVAG